LKGWIFNTLILYRCCIVCIFLKKNEHTDTTTTQNIFKCIDTIIIVVFQLK
jgi:hypothetical protein